MNFRKKIDSAFITDLLRNPLLLLASFILGAIIGLFQPSVATTIAPFGRLYLLLLKMCVLPILISAITMSIARLMTQKGAGTYIKRILVVFPVMQLGLSIFAVIAANITRAGNNLNTKTLESLGVLVNKSGIDLEISISGPIPPEEPAPGFSDFIFNLVPDNIFDALSEGDTLKVLFFSIIFGIFVGIQQKVSHKEASLLDIFESVYQAFNKLIFSLTLFLPFALCSLIASQVAKTGLNVVLAMINFVVAGVGTFVVIYLINTPIIWWRSRCSPLKVLSSVKEPIILALATSNALVCLPSSISALSDSLKFNRQTTDLIVPLTITIGRFGQIVYFALASEFVVQLYNQELGLGGIATIVIGSILAGMASSGATGIVTLTMLGIVLQPLGLPLEAVLVLFIAIDPIMDPFRTTCNVYSGMTATALIADRDTDETSTVPEEYVTT
jgi:Na+/H+-dicarboxylate symporter